MPRDYAAFLREIFDGGGEFVIATSMTELVGLALFRCYTTTRCGKRFYVDDLVTDDALRSRGVGAALLRALERIATVRGAPAIELESGSERQRTHHFYLREGFERFAVSFRKQLTL